MNSHYLHSIILELCANNAGTIAVHRGDHTHALFLDLVRQVDPVLSSRLHGEPEYRPFTVSMLSGVNRRNGKAFLQMGQPYRLRVTLLDGGHLWQNLSAYFLQSNPITLRLDKAEFSMMRVLTTSSADMTGWAGYADWQTLAATSSRKAITMRFASPSAFSMGDRRFALFPEPILLWDSLMRSWNRYAPDVLQIDKTAMRDFVTHNVTVSDYNLHTTCLYFPKYAQKGFIGTCSYSIQETSNACAPQLSALAEFARYSGVGYKTTMGMGQTRIEVIEESLHY
ncbi:MAG: CRISPR system precrRNA processing endoribonuclease RAMP protein Cas6, partial [Ktedonobacteraceae bacterium]